MGAGPLIRLNLSSETSCHKQGGDGLPEGASGTEHIFVCWSMSEAGADLMGSFDTFEAMVRVNGRTPTASWLLVTLFCDVFGMDRSVYIGFPRDALRETGGTGWSSGTAQHSTPMGFGRTRCSSCDSPVAESTLCHNTWISLISTRWCEHSSQLLSTTSPTPDLRVADRVQQWPTCVPLDDRPSPLEVEEDGQQEGRRA